MIPRRPVKPETASATQEVLAGLGERITFHNTENGFCVLLRQGPGTETS
jgi:hypothetical protein